MASPPDLLAQAHRLLISGRAGEARPLLEKLAAQPDCPVGVVRQLAELDILDGEGQRAMERLEPLPPTDHEAEFLRARAQVVLGQHEGAKHGLLGLRSRLPSPSVALELHLASVHERLGESEEAIGALRRAIALKPDTLAAHKNLAVLLAARGRHAESRDVLRVAVGIAPKDAGLRVRLAQVLSTLSDGAAAQESLGHAVERDPTAEQWHQIAQLHAEYWRYEEADKALQRSAAMRPGVAAVASLHAGVQQELGDTQGALRTLGESLARSPADLNLAIAERLMLPQVYANAEDAAHWRARYTQGIERLEGENGRWLANPGQVFEVVHNNFLLAYQGEDDRDLQRRYSGLLAGLAAKAAPEWRAGRTATFDGSRRLRVGFLANIFRECTAGRYFERWITGLDGKRFERFVYHTSPIADEFTARIAASSEHFIPLRVTARETAARLFADELDVIVYPEVGMAPLTYLLAALKLAPVQLAGWGHPVTTGSDAIDGFLTCAAMEPGDAARHYVERPVPLPGLGVDYSMPAVEPPLPRSKLGLPEDRRLYICPQSLFKIHPEMDELFADVLAGDAGGLLLFFQATARAVTDQFAQRLQATLARRGIPPRGQVKFLPRMSGSHFRRMLGACDVMLDTVRWSGGNTSLDALAAGVPVVTLPGRFMRGRQTEAMLRMAGLEELIAASPEEYVRIALEVAQDRQRNAQLRETIARRRADLFDRREPVEALSEALLRMGAGRPP